MKKILAVLALGAVAAFPMTASADDVQTPGDCASSAAPGYVVQTGASNGRGSFCVSDGDASNGNELYVGGDATQPCGQIEVAGIVVTGSSGGEAGNPDYCH